MAMKLVAVCFLCLLGSTAAASFRANSGTGSPVERVVNLLKDLAAQIAKDKKVEQEMYDKYACWCEKTATRKAADIEDGLEEMRALSQKILTLKGKVATLKSEIAELTADIKKNEEEQADATNIRTKQNTAFMAESAEMKDALKALQSAIKVLADATLPGSALVQEGAQAQSRMAVHAVLDALPSRVSLPLSKVSMLSAFTSGSNKYAPQSATIQGILVDMYTTFSSDLMAATTTEAKQNTDFEDFIATKMEEKIELEKTKAAKEEELATAEADLAESVETYDTTFAQKEADIKFFDETKKACTEKYEEWTTRSGLRMEELKGIEKAIEILTADSARDTFRVAIKAGKETGADASINPESFLQVSKDFLENSPTVKAYNALKARATHSHSLRLAALAVQVRTAKYGHFEPVIKAIDEMMVTLKDEAAADLAKKTTCLEEYQKINLTLSDLTWKISVNDAKITKLENKIELLTEEKEKTIAEIKATDEHLAAIKKQREEEHAAFLQAKKEDTEAISLLKEARTALMEYYKKNGIAIGPIQGEMKGLSLVSEDPVFSISEDQAPDATFSKKSSHKIESKDIVSLMTYLIQDLEDEVRNGISTEAAQQTSYEEEKATAEALKAALISKKNVLSDGIAKAGKDKQEENALKDKNLDEKATESVYHADIKPDCDWIIGAFDKRAEARAAEMKGLTEAKEYLAGYQGSLLEKKAKSFDDNKLASVRFLNVGN